VLVFVSDLGRSQPVYGFANSVTTGLCNKVGVNGIIGSARIRRDRNTAAAGFRHRYVLEDVF
jgi:hypothetical protein